MVADRNICSDPEGRPVEEDDPNAAKLEIVKGQPVNPKVKARLGVKMGENDQLTYEGYQPKLEEKPGEDQAETSFPRLDGDDVNNKAVTGPEANKAIDPGSNKGAARTRGK